MAIQLVVFDLGGVLVRVLDEWQDAFTHAGLNLPPGTDAKRFWTEHRSLSHSFDTGKMSINTFVEKFCRALHGVTPAQFRSAIDAWLLGMFADVERLLVDLRRAGIVTACLSNTNSAHWDTFKTNPIYAPLKRLDHRYASHEIGFLKPEPGAYRHVERVLGIKPANILFFDDKPENVHGAKACGWNAETIQNDGEPVRQVRTHLGAYEVGV